MSGIEGLGRGEQAGSDFAAISCSGSSSCPCPRTEAHWAALGEEGARELLQRIAALTEERNALQAASDECARQTAEDEARGRSRAFEEMADAFGLFTWTCLDHGGEEVARIRDIIYAVRDRASPSGETTK